VNAWSTLPNEEQARENVRMKSKANNNALNDIVVDVPPEERTSCELVTLIRKLRWIGMETEAGQLQTVLRKISPNRRPSLMAISHSTD
jgi:hypothetical protein